MKKLIVSLLILAIITFAGWYWLNNINNFQRTGEIEISINEEPIKIIREENGMPYVLASNKADAIRGQAFVNAQDRLFQIEFYRSLIRGEAASVVGPSMLNSDIKMRVLDLYGNAEKSYQYLSKETKQMLQWYCEGFNEYLTIGKDEFPVELSLLGIEPKPLNPVDIISVTHFVGLFHSQNLEDEVLTLNLAAHMEDYKKLLPTSINLDRTKPLTFNKDTSTLLSLNKDMFRQQEPEPLLPYPKLGSNNWAIAGEKSASGKPILSNDPHVDARLLPSNFYPIGIFCPEFKAVGIAIPGVPGLLAGRNEFVSFGVTNAYGDSQDLFIENIKGDYYGPDSAKSALTKRKETIKVKDSADVELEIRLTERGPIISDFAVFNVLTEDDVSLKWSLAETKSHSLGIDQLLETKNATQFQQALSGMDNMFFNYVFADVEGNIAHQATGLVPIRKNHKGAIPQIASPDNSWIGFIPKSELPHTINPERGWVATANHDTRPDDYPHYYSSHFAPYYRYKRISQILSKDKRFNAEELWEIIFDVKNTQAEELTPLFIAALKKDKETQDLAKILADWNYEESIDKVGATVYNVLYNELLYLILNDELPDKLEDLYWENVYYWNQRLDRFITSGHEYIDNSKTAEKESLSDLILEAGQKTEKLLNKRLGDDKSNWTWGRIHTLEFASPIRQEGFGSTWLGKEVMPKSGSNQTLNRGGFIKNTDREFETSWFSSFRMVADMKDDEKMMAILSGGTAARILHPYYKSQLEQWKNNQWIPYWISEDKVLENAKFELTLK